MAGKYTAVLFMYFIACSSIAGTRVEETATAIKRSKQAMEETAAFPWSMNLMTKYEFKTTIENPSTQERQELVIPKNTEGKVEVQFCSEWQNICNCKGIMIYGSDKASGQDDFFSQHHNMMITHGETACDSKSFYGNPATLYKNIHPQCLCIHGEFKGIRPQKFKYLGLPFEYYVVPIWVSAEAPDWASQKVRMKNREYGQQWVPNLRCSDWQSILYSKLKNNKGTKLSVRWIQHDDWLRLIRTGDGTKSIVVVAWCLGK